MSLSRLSPSAHDLVIRHLGNLRLARLNLELRRNEQRASFCRRESIRKPHCFSHSFQVFKVVLTLDIQSLFQRQSLNSIFVTQEESEWEEVERELGTSPKYSEAQNSPQSRNVAQYLRQRLHPVIAEAFILTFLAEWGDRSQVCLLHLWLQDFLIFVDVHTTNVTDH